MGHTPEEYARATCSQVITWALEEIVAEARVKEEHATPPWTRLPKRGAKRLTKMLQNFGVTRQSFFR